MPQYQAYSGEFAGEVSGPQLTGCFVKESWGDEWIYVPHLQVLTDRTSVSGSIGFASFSWWYSKEILQQGNRWVGLYEPLNISGWYIKVEGYDEFGSALLWVGQVALESFDFDEADGVTGDPQGHEAIQAFGLEYLLNRRQVNGSYVEGGDTFVDRVVVFNRRNERGETVSGNRSESVNGDGLYTFSLEGVEWSYLDILEYVLAYFQPSGISFYLTGQTGILAQIVDEVSVSGMTPFEILNALVSPRRGLGWRIVTSGEGDVGIYVFSVLAEAISVGDFEMPANPYRFSLNLDGFFGLQPKLGFDAISEYDLVEVLGAQVKTVFSVGMDSGIGVWPFVMEPAWGAEASNYGLASNEARQQRDLFERVFTKFRLPVDFDWSDLTPWFNWDGSFGGVGGGSWNGDKAFERFLVLPELTTKTDAEFEYREPFVLCQPPPGLEYRFVERLSATPESPFQPGRILMGDREASVSVEGAYRHYFALNHYVAADGERAPRIDYDTFVFTLCVRTDARLRAAAPLLTGAPSESGKTLTLHVPDAEFWYCAENTVEDLDDDGGVVYRNGGAAEILRDDGARVRAVLGLALAVYGQQRAKLRLAFEGLHVFLPTGVLVDSVSVGYVSSAVGTVVSDVFHDHTTTPQRTVYRTSFEELDVVGALDRRHMLPSGARPVKFAGRAAHSAKLAGKAGKFGGVVGAARAAGSASGAVRGVGSVSRGSR